MWARITPLCKANDDKASDRARSHDLVSGCPLGRAFPSSKSLPHAEQVRHPTSICPQNRTTFEQPNPPSPRPGRQMSGRIQFGSLEEQERERLRRIKEGGVDPNAPKVGLSFAVGLLLSPACLSVPVHSTPQLPVLWAGFDAHACCWMCAMFLRCCSGRCNNISTPTHNTHTHTNALRSEMACLSACFRRVSRQETSTLMSKVK